MTEAELYEAFTDLIRDVLDDDTIVVSPETTAENVQGWDSQAHVMLIVATEQRFGVRFRTSEFESLRNVGEFVNLIASKLKNR